MPRAATRKREKEKELAETAKKMRKLTIFFGTAPTKAVVEPDTKTRSRFRHCRQLRKLHQPFYLIILIPSQV